jgi:hypothetical protein
MYDLDLSLVGLKSFMILLDYRSYMGLKYNNLIMLVIVFVLVLL